MDHAADRAARPTDAPRELVLRERDGDYEIISNGVFLMDTRDGRSERLLVDATLQALRPATDLRIVIAGLGVGWSLGQALAAPDVSEIRVLEWEQAIVDFSHEATGARTGGHLDDPRVRCEIVDVVDWLRAPVAGRVDAFCLDVDNGPGWTVAPGNTWLYTDAGLAAIHARLVDGGVLGVWSAARDPAFEDRLRRRFSRIARHEVPVARGAPDVVWVAQRG